MSKKVISVDNCPKAVGPYSQAVEVGNFIFVSGNLPIDPKTEQIVGTNAKDQTKQVMENIKTLLAAKKLSMDKIVKTTIFLQNMDDFSVVNEVYASYFTKDYPARSTVEVARLPKSALVEIECIVTY